MRKHEETLSSSTEEENAARAVVGPAALPRVVIVGAGFGGLEAAKKLADFPVQITVLDRQNYHLFQPMLYQVATAGLSMEEISAPIRHILSQYRNIRVVQAEVTGIDTVAQRVLTADAAYPYDYLILAAGASSNYFGHEEWQRQAPGMKSLSDAMRLRRRILGAFELAEQEPDPLKREARLTFVLIGGGPTGVELAGAIAELAHRALAHDFRHIDPTAARIVLIEGEPRILSAFPAALTRRAHHRLEQLGVEIRTGMHVTHVTDEGVMIGTEFLLASTVIWTAGVKASTVGAWLEAETDQQGRVLVQSDLSVPGAPNVFVIGDTAHVTQQGQALPGLSPVALQEARYVAALITYRMHGKPPMGPFHYVNKGMLATVGRGFAIAEVGPLHLWGLPGWLFWVGVHLFYLIGFRNRLLVMIQYAWAYLTFQPGARIILPADPMPSRQEQVVGPSIVSHPTIPVHREAVQPSSATPRF